MAIAYQAGIPIITVPNFEGWAENLSGTYIDARKRLKCIEATSPEEALINALNVIKS